VPPPDRAPPSEPLETFAADATSGRPVDPGSIEIAAVGSGPETRRRRRGLGVAAWFSIGWLVLVVGLALLAPVLPIDDPNENITAIARRGPLADAGTAPGHLLGGDFNGRDMFSRLIWGARTTLMVATISVLIGFVFGGVMGLLGGYFRGKVDIVVSLLLDVLLAIPAVVLALALVTILRTQPGTKGGGLDPTVALVLALGFVAIPVLGRITRASTLTWAQREFVTAARSQGATHRRILVREVLPNVLPAMASIALLSIAVAIVAEGSLAILGAGVDPSIPTWGNMIALGRGFMQRAPYIVFEPALMIFFTVLALNMLGDAVRAHFDVREGGL
jgi:peptide/nickel transport system permease protein